MSYLLKNDGSNCIKSSFELLTKINPLTNVSNIITLDFKDFFNNIILTDLQSTINTLFIEYFPSLNLPVNSDTDYFNTLTKFPLFHSYIFRNNALYTYSGHISGSCFIKYIIRFTYLFL